MSKLGKEMRKFAKELPKRMAAESAPEMLAAAEAGYPQDKVRTGAAQESFSVKNRGVYVKILCGVRKKKSKSGKRRKRRTTGVNYAGFIDGLWDDAGIVAAIGEAVAAIGEA